jgi:uncharacterized Zn finger protein
MCKHVAAVLYGVGARLDQQPELIFTLRRVDAKDLVTQAGAGLPKSRQSPTPNKVLDKSLLADVFGIEMAEVAPAAEPDAASHKSTATKVAKTAARVAPATTRKARKGGGTEATKKTAAAQKPVQGNVPAKSSASPGKSTTGKAKNGGATTVPKGKTATAGYVPRRSVKEKSR